MGLVVGVFFKESGYISMVNLTFHVGTLQMDDTLVKQLYSPLQLCHKPHTLALEQNNCYSKSAELERCNLEIYVSALFSAGKEAVITSVATR